MSHYTWTKSKEHARQNVPKKFIIALKQQVEPTVKISSADLRYNIMN
jgi:hypothetical protein